MIKLHDLILQIFKEEILEYLNNFNLKDYPYMSKRIETRFKTFISESLIIDTNNLIISSRREVIDSLDVVELENLDISEESYFVYNYCGHSDDWIIHEFTALKETEEYLLEESDNIFTTYLFVFKNLKRLKYKINDSSILWING